MKYFVARTRLYLAEKVARGFGFEKAAATIKKVRSDLKRFHGNALNNGTRLLDPIRDEGLFSHDLEPTVRRAFGREPLKGDTWKTARGIHNKALILLLEKGVNMIDAQVTKVLETYDYGILA